MQGLKNLSSNLVQAAQNLRANVRGKLGSGRTYQIGERVVWEERKLSEGGFAFVFVVRDTGSGEEYALKKILCQDKERYTLAKREIEMLERIPSHPNVVRYLGSTILAGESGGGGQSREVCILMEFCRDGHLLSLLDAHDGQLAEDVIVGIFHDVCKGVAHLHGQRPPIVHRDLKIENILGAGGHYKLCDFGSCSTEQIQPKTCARERLLKLQEEIEKYTTMMYRPPEMVDFYKGYELSDKVDIWMLGCILYTLVFYRHPFQDQSPLAIANANYSMPLDTIRVSTGGGGGGGGGGQGGGKLRVGPKLLDLVHWMLAADPRDRPSAAELCRILSKYASISPSALQSYLPPAVLQKSQRMSQQARDHNPDFKFAPIDPSAVAMGGGKKPSKDKDKPKKKRHQHLGQAVGGGEPFAGWTSSPSPPPASPPQWATAGFDANSGWQGFPSPVQQLSDAPGPVTASGGGGGGGNWAVFDEGDAGKARPPQPQLNSGWGFLPPAVDEASHQQQQQQAFRPPLPNNMMHNASPNDGVMAGMPPVGNGKPASPGLPPDLFSLPPQPPQPTPNHHAPLPPSPPWQQQQQQQRQPRETASLPPPSPPPLMQQGGMVQANGMPSFMSPSFDPSVPPTQLSGGLQSAQQQPTQPMMQMQHIHGPSPGGQDVGGGLDLINEWRRSPAPVLQSQAQEQHQYQQQQQEQQMPPQRAARPPSPTMPPSLPATGFYPTQPQQPPLPDVGAGIIMQAANDPTAAAQPTSYSVGSSPPPTAPYQNQPMVPARSSSPLQSPSYPQPMASGGMGMGGGSLQPPMRTMQGQPFASPMVDGRSGGLPRTSSTPSARVSSDMTASPPQPYSQVPSPTMPADPFGRSISVSGPVASGGGAIGGPAQDLLTMQMQRNADTLSSGVPRQTSQDQPMQPQRLAAPQSMMGYQPTQQPPFNNAAPQQQQRPSSAPSQHHQQQQQQNGYAPYPQSFHSGPLTDGNMVHGYPPPAQGPPMQPTAPSAAPGMVAMGGAYPQQQQQQQQGAPMPQQTTHGQQMQMPSHPQQFQQYQQQGGPSAGASPMVPEAGAGWRRQISIAANNDVTDRSYATRLR
ncbi:unnamed protein product [Vitrella brassicaformis CCMP3155]|uniref:non-specific serine/threonine protein kinase n=1 Tax=Vitrella brassicaformis (strain CCMP3155) TaxID=1169540 RepID=A0A0G4F821_VITBC|nr:unnamed protein product [Vitrella brassicaformis CCMP3155]|eukprot:CEM08694.1 unnamed protein product [Vitrella brassicaformis CCMP3155]